MRLKISYCGLCILFLVLVGCGGGSISASGGPSPAPTPSPTPIQPGTIPAVDHVFLIMLENHGFAQVIGSPSMPYLNSLATQHALATNYFADTHPSLGNYFMLTVGMEETNPVIGDLFPGPVSDDNIPRAFAAAGKTWKSYTESLPSAGYTGGDVYPYLKHHNPFVYFTDVLNSAAETANVVPFTQLASDLSSGTVPNLVYIAPNVENDAHDCPGGGSSCTDDQKLAAADTWLKSNIDPLINSPALANSVFIIVFDEALDIDIRNGGGQVPMVMVGSHVKPGFQSSTFFQHESTLRVILDLLRVTDHPGASATAPTMQEFFQ